MMYEESEAARGVVIVRYKENTGFWQEKKFYSKTYTVTSHGAMMQANRFAADVESGKAMIRGDDKLLHTGGDIMLVRKYKEITTDTSWKEV